MAVGVLGSGEQRVNILLAATGAGQLAWPAITADANTEDRDETKSRLTVLQAQGGAITVNWKGDTAVTAGLELPVGGVHFTDAPIRDLVFSGSGNLLVMTFE